MNTTQRNAANHQSDNGGNELDVSSSRAGTDDPASPAGNHLAADRKMDDDTGLSNTANRTPEPDRQDLQSNVGRRSDGTPD
ncbi:MAG: hypothetical protein QFF03_18135 [Pseudomonadota bacterium]|nr:hypothetical protein [Pseudomonadota bacterium]